MKLTKNADDFIKDADDFINETDELNWREKTRSLTWIGLRRKG
ncbi:hypothetical protein ACGE0T_04280 [Parabacteroides sp. APC149_11_2_Y6]